MLYSILPSRILLPLEAVQLGRLTVNLNDPQSDFLDPASLVPRDTTVQQQDHFRGEETTTVGNSVGASLTHLLSIAHSKKRSNALGIIAERTSTYILNNSGQWFQEIVRDESTRKWIGEVNRRGDDIFLMVGYHTVLNAQVTESGVKQRSTSGQIILPIAEALTATGTLVLPFSELIDPSTTVKQERQRRGYQQFSAPGEQVCAVQYRKVHFKWYSRGELHEQPLKPNRWQACWTFRGQTDDVVEVGLQDDLDLDDDDLVDLIIVTDETFSSPSDVAASSSNVAQPLGS